MITSAAVLAFLVLAGLAVFQLLLVAGRPWGRFAWGGQHEVLPPRLRIGSVVSLVVYAVIAAVVLQAGGRAELLPGGFVEVGIWVITGYFVLGIALNAMSRSRPERLVMTPVAALLAGCCLVVALG
ncbi:UNVERIFIED_ORG: hypothetical protein E4P37_10790 [Bacillus sp. AZ43]